MQGCYNGTFGVAGPAPNFRRRPCIARNQSNMGRVERGREIARRRARRVKLQKLRTKFAKANDQGTKNAILEKVRKISPFLDLEATTKPAAPKAPKAAKTKK